MKKKELLVIIPAYNEETNIVRVLDDLEQPEIAEIADVLVMNDASSDATNWIVKARGHALVTHVFKLGYGSALQLGYKYAIRRGYRYVIQKEDRRSDNRTAGSELESRAVLFKIQSF